MSTSRSIAVLTLIISAASLPLSAQIPLAEFGSGIRSGVAYQSYVLGSGLAFDRISQLVIPITAFQRFGSRLTLDVAAAYASSSVRTTQGAIELSGLIDTDVRATVVVVPGRLLLTMAGTLPTGHATVADTALPLYGATATDLLGFTAPSFGGGGAITGGLASAFRVGGSWALGTAISYRRALAYVPMSGGEELAPGAEGRLRIGVEGPLSRSVYFRGALVYAASGVDEFSGGTRSAMGDRALVYGSLNLPLGRGALSAYAWDMRRLRPRETQNVVTTPRGNVLAVGIRYDRPLSPSLILSPALEARHELSGYQSLEQLGFLVRPGADLTWRLRRGPALVLQAHFGIGRLQDEGTTVSLMGPRLGAMLEWTR